MVFMIHGSKMQREQNAEDASESERNLSRVVGYLEHCVNMIKLIFTGLITSCHMSTCTQWLPDLLSTQSP